MNELNAILRALGRQPEDQGAWLALANWLRDNATDGENAAVKLFWSAIADRIAMGMTIEQALALLKRNARNRCKTAQEFEEAAILIRE